MDGHSFRTTEKGEARVHEWHEHDTRDLRVRSEDKQLTVDDLFRIVFQRNKLIIGAALMGSVVALLASFFVPEVYESRGVIQVGRVMESNSLVEPTETLVERLKEQYRVGDSSEGAAQLPFLKSVRINRADKGMIVVTAYGRTEVEAQAFLNGLANKVLKDHHGVFNRSMGIAEEHLAHLNQQLEMMNQQVVNLSARVTEIGKRDIASAVLLTAERSELLNQIARTQQQRYVLLSSMEEARPSALIRKPTLPTHRVAPMRLFYVVIGGFIALVVGILVALVEDRTNIRRFAKITKRATADA